MNSNKKKCILIEDEFYALELLENFISQAGNIEIAGKFRHPLPAYDILSKGEIDLLFLDIDLPQMNGLAFLKQIPSKPVTIITTAHSNFASDAFNEDVADYLVKPYSFERFQKAIAKAERWNEKLHNQLQSIQVKSNGYWINIPFADILYIEGWKEYVKIHCKEKTIISLLSLSYLEKELPADSFLRIHKSYIVSVNQIKSFNADEVVLSSSVNLPISRSKKDIVVSQLKKSV